MSHRGAEEHSGPGITGALATTQQTENLLPSQNQVFDSAKVFKQAVVRKGLYFLTTVPSKKQERYARCESLSWEAGRWASTQP